MSGKNKKKVLIIWLCLLFLPFILLTDLFPFMRFGMFAEPVVRSIQNEKFEVHVTKDNIHQPFDCNEINILPNIFFYLSRNYYYRNEGELFLKQISNLSENSENTEWHLKRIVLHKEADKNDTLTVAIYRK
ncbi:MAG: hypothetical protein ACK4ND_15080 [Cytophagaceae bacterium]